MREGKFVRGLGSGEWEWFTEGLTAKAQGGQEDAPGSRRSLLVEQTLPSQANHDAGHGRLLHIPDT